ncbi:hypothetical protein NAF17_00880 [Mucilaginibacter sp. RB4R14]|uniref:hypothetical protein n=1 Tax=Mucilaginibacter aurantiaciroseus TaxID=2949308 RepID=UPI0020913787|nr:hypothetical protein [Mucilaginibacter aurantiaciroseus]MCO5934078.1 hypothetical protein [Mucilaginibacter aurantiaciroseus]
MNIDDLKGAWKNEEPGFAHLSISDAMYGKTTSAVNRLRRNMKGEFIATLFSYLIFIWFFFRQTDAFLFNITGLLFFTMLVLNTYYFFKFYVFYRSISDYNSSLKNSIAKIAYELELNIEIYKAYNFCITPIAIMVAIGILCGKHASAYILQGLTDSNNITAHLLIMLGVLLISFAGTYVFINLHVQSKYGKYLKELKLIINDLGEDAV